MTMPIVRQTSRLILLSAVLAFCFCGGCEGLFSTPIKEIIDNPRQYDGRQVTVSGEVTDVFALLVIKSFTLKDSTGQITVITNRALPKPGSKMGVKGTVREAFAIGDRQLIVIIEDDK